MEDNINEKKPLKKAKKKKTRPNIWKILTFVFGAVSVFFLSACVVGSCSPSGEKSEATTSQLKNNYVRNVRSDRDYSYYDIDITNYGYCDIYITLEQLYKDSDNAYYTDEDHTWDYTLKMGEAETYTLAFSIDVDMWDYWNINICSTKTLDSGDVVNWRLYDYSS